MNEDKKPCEYWPLAPKTGYYNIGGKRVWLEAEDPFPEIAPRTWVGLTDEDRVQIKKAADYNQFMTAGEYADKVQKLTEEKLRSKNHG